MLRVVRFQAAASVPVAATPEPRPGSLPEAASCLVFRQGNELGFWVYPPFDASVTWHGGMDFEVTCPDQLGERLWAATQEELTGWPSRWWCSKLDGVFQLDPGLVFETHPGAKLLMTGTLNRPDPAYWVHAGVLDSDWFHVPSSINLEPYAVGAKFELRRDQPIAQIVVLDDAVSRRSTLEAAEIEERPDVLELWRGYMRDKFGVLDSRADDLAPAKPGTYARWKSGVERRGACPVTRARELLAGARKNEEIA